MKLLLSTLSSLIFLLSCANQKQTSQVSPNEKDLLSKAYLELGSPLEIQKSPGESYSLCMKKDKSYDGMIVEFLVVDNVTGDIVLAKKKVRGKVEWESEQKLKVLNYAGQIEDSTSTTEDQVYYIEINPSKKI